MSLIAPDTARALVTALTEITTAAPTPGAEADVPEVFTRTLSEIQARIAAEISRRDQIMALAVHGAGMSPRSVAIATGLHHNTVVARAQDPDNHDALRRFKTLEAELMAQRPVPLPQVVLPVGPSSGSISWFEYGLPLGLTGTGSTAVWEPARHGHLLITGAAGTGKTSLAHSLIQQLTTAGVEVWPVAGDDREFGGYQSWPAIGLLPDSLEASIRTLTAAMETLHTRFDEVRTGTGPVSLRPIVIVIDAVDSLIGRADALYRAQHPESVASHSPLTGAITAILRLGRSVHLHLAVTHQPGPTALLEGPAHDNFGQQISLGTRPTPDIAPRVQTALGPDLADVIDHPGRGFVLRPEPASIQTVWGADPLSTEATSTSSTAHSPRSVIEPLSSQDPSWEEITTARITHQAPPQDRHQFPAPALLRGFTDWNQARTHTPTS